MSIWKNRLDLKDLWEKRDKQEITLQKMGKEIAKRIRLLRCYKREEDTLEDIALNFEYMEEDVNEFDSILAELYDWGDISLDGKFGGKKMCWIATRF